MGHFGLDVKNLISYEYWSVAFESNSLTIFYKILSFGLTIVFFMLQSLISKSKVALSLADAKPGIVVALIEKVIFFSVDVSIDLVRHSSMEVHYLSLWGLLMVIDCFVSLSFPEIVYSLKPHARKFGSF